jgi:hypothetical protein
MKRFVLAAVVTMVALSAPVLSSQQPTKRQAVPQKDALDRAVLLVGELFREELAKAGGDTATRLKVAQTFLQEAKDTNDDPAGKYVLLRESAALAGQAGDAAVALQALEEMALSFDIPAPAIRALKTQTLQSASQAVGTPESYQGLVEASLALLDDAVAMDDFEQALMLGATAETAAKKLKSVALVSAVRKRTEAVKELHGQFKAVKPFLDTLAKNPKDGKANLEAGRYEALVKGNWDRGLPLLARGSDTGLSKLAALDISSPKDWKTAVDVAKGWLGESEKNKNQPNNHALQRAYHWYQRGLDAPGITAAQRDTCATAMKQINEILPPDQRIGDIAVELRRCTGHEGPVYTVAMNGDGSKVASGGADGSVRLWDAKTAKELRRFIGHGSPVWTVRLSPDGSHLLSGGLDNTIRLWDLVSGRESKRFTGHNDYVRAAVFSADGQRILSGGDDRTVKVWEAGGPGAEARTMRGHDHYVFCTALSRDGKLGLSASLDRTARLWDVDTGSTLQVLAGHTDTVLSVAFLPDGQRALTGSTDKTLRLWDLKSGQTLQVFKGHAGYVNGVAVSADGRRALSAGQDGKVILWDVERGALLRVLEGHTGTVWGVAFSGDGRLAASAGNDGTVRIWGSAK